MYHAHSSLPLTCSVNILQTVFGVVASQKLHPEIRSGVPRKVESCAWFPTWMHRNSRPSLRLQRLKMRQNGCAFVSQVLCRHHRGPHGRCRPWYESDSPNTTCGEESAQNYNRKVSCHAKRYHTARLHSPHSSSLTPTLLTTTPILSPSPCLRSRATLRARSNADWGGA